MAQIIASRSQQANFQLILITHDEDFVSMLKTELSTLTGFSMPEKYYRMLYPFIIEIGALCPCPLHVTHNTLLFWIAGVYREMGNDSKFYSKIKAVDWSDVGWIAEAGWSCLVTTTSFLHFFYYGHTRSLATIT